MAPTSLAGGGASSLVSDTTSVGSASPSVKLFYSLSDHASRRRCHEQTGRRLVGKHLLTPVQVGRLVRFTEAEVLRFERAGGRR